MALKKPSTTKTSAQNEVGTEEETKTKTQAVSQEESRAAAKAEVAEREVPADQAEGEETEVGNEEEAEALEAGEPEFEEADEPDPSPQRAVATRTETATAVASTDPAPQRHNQRGMIQTAVDNLADAGFEGLTVGGLAFDRIKLPGEGIFLMGEEEIELGKQFDCIIQNTRNVFIIRQSDERDAETYYSYHKEGLLDTEGNDRTETLREWREEGYEKPDIRKYIEVQAILLLPEDSEFYDEYHTRMVTLSIPPASGQKFSGFLMQTAQKYGRRLRKEVLPDEFITTCMVGKKRGSGSEAYYPWTFKDGGMDLPEVL